MSDLVNLYNQFANSGAIILAIICLICMISGMNNILLIPSVILLIWEIPILLLILSMLSGGRTPYMDLPIFVQIICVILGIAGTIKGTIIFNAIDLIKWGNTSAAAFWPHIKRDLYQGYHQESC